MHSFPRGLGHHLGLEVHDVSRQPLLSYNRDGSNNTWLNEGKHFSSPNGGGCRELHYRDLNQEPRAQGEFDVSLLEENMVLTVEPGVCGPVVHNGPLHIHTLLNRLFNLHPESNLPG